MTNEICKTYRSWLQVFHCASLTLCHHALNQISIFKALPISNNGGGTVIRNSCLRDYCYLTNKLK